MSDTAAYGSEVVRQYSCTSIITSGLHGYGRVYQGLFEIINHFLYTNYRKCCIIIFKITFQR